MSFTPFFFVILLTLVCLYFGSAGIVKDHKFQGSELLYCVEKDGQSTWYGRTAVILTMEQGSRLREQYGLGPYEPSTPQTMASDISLGECSRAPTPLI